MSDQLSKLSDATRMLAEVRDAKDAKLLMDKAAAAKHFATKHKLGKEAVANAHEIMVRAEAMMGEFLQAMEKAGPQYSRGGGSKGSKREPLPNTPPTLADVGVTKRESSQAQKLAALKSKEPKKFEAVATGEKTKTQAIREARRAEVLADVQLPKEKYRVVYADPPWKYNDKCENGSIQSGGADAHYPSMSISALCDMPIVDMVEDNAVLFLWVTSPLVYEAFPIIKAWGFTYKTSFVWDKIKHNMGHYNSVRHEFLLVCTRGSCLPDVPKLFDSVISVERTEHSAKPEDFRKIIDELYPYGKRIELFARRTVKGWDAYGNAL